MFNMYAYACLDGVGNMSEILDYINYKPNNTIGLKYDLLKTIIYRTSQMEPKVKVACVQRGQWVPVFGVLHVKT